MRTSASDTSPLYDAVIRGPLPAIATSPFAFSSALATSTLSLLPKYGSNAAASTWLPSTCSANFSGLAVTVPLMPSAPFPFSVSLPSTASGFVRSSLTCLTLTFSGATCSLTGFGVDSSVKLAVESASAIWPI